MGFWVTCDVKMMSLRHGWSWRPPQTATYTKCLSTYWYAVHRHMIASLHIYTHPTWLRIWDDIMLPPHPHVNMLSQNDVLMSWLRRLTATSYCPPHPSLALTKCLSTFICCPRTFSTSITQLYPYYLARIWGFWVTCWTKWCHYVLVEADSHLKLLLSYMWDIYKVLDHIDMQLVLQVPLKGSWRY